MHALEGMAVTKLLDDGSACILGLYQVNAVYYRSSTALRGLFLHTDIQSPHRVILREASPTALHKIRQLIFEVRDLLCCYCLAALGAINTPKIAIQGGVRNPDGFCSCP